MLPKLHKIPDKTLFRAIFAVLILWNLKYFFLIVQIPFSLLLVNYQEKNPLHAQVSAIRHEIKNIKDFQDEGKIGFICDEPQASVFDLQDSIKNFYLAQYAIVPSILKNDTTEKYVIGSYEKNIALPLNYGVYKKIHDKLYIFKKETK